MNATICRACAAVLTAEDQTDGATPKSAPLQAGEADPSDASEPDVDNPRAERTSGDCDCRRDRAARPRGSWKCVGCGERVPKSFDLCWNCGQTPDGEETPGFAIVDHREEPPETATDDLQTPLDTDTPIEPCTRCGSTKVVPDIALVAQLPWSSPGTLDICVRSPGRWSILKALGLGVRQDTVRGSLCGNCGHIELRVDAAAELYNAYREHKAASDGS